MNTFRETQQAKGKGITDQGQNEAIYSLSLIGFFRIYLRFQLLFLSQSCLCLSIKNNGRRKKEADIKQTKEKEMLEFKICFSQ